MANRFSVQWPYRLTTGSKGPKTGLRSIEICSEKPKTGFLESNTLFLRPKAGHQGQKWARDRL